MKMARMSFGSDYECKQKWNDETFVQCGASGIVLCEKEDNYETAFFESFPRDPDCFLRGEGHTIEEAEEKCFAKWQNILNCKGHEFESRGRKDDYGYCMHCPLSQSGVLTPAFNCIVCEVPCFGNSDKDDQQYCKEHYYELTPEQAVKLKGEDESNYALVTDKRMLKYFNQNKAKLSCFQALGMPIEGKEFKLLDDLFRQFVFKAENEFKKLKGIKKLGFPEEYDYLMIAHYPEIAKSIKAHYEKD
jgi:hypothetical protein